MNNAQHISILVYVLVSNGKITNTFAKRNEAALAAKTWNKENKELGVRTRFKVEARFAKAICPTY